MGWERGPVQVNELGTHRAHRACERLYSFIVGGRMLAGNLTKARDPLTDSVGAKNSALCSAAGEHGRPRPQGIAQSRDQGGSDWIGSRGSVGIGAGCAGGDGSWCRRENRPSGRHWWQGVFERHCTLTSCDEVAEGCGGVELVPLLGERGREAEVRQEAAGSGSEVGDARTCTGPGVLGSSRRGVVRESGENMLVCLGQCAQSHVKRRRRDSRARGLAHARIRVNQ